MLENKGNVLALYKDGVSVNELSEGEQGVVVLDNTPFYAESGGQVGDSGELRSVGIDVATVRADGDPPMPVYVRTDTISEVGLG